MQHTGRQKLLFRSVAGVMGMCWGLAWAASETKTLNLEMNVRAATCTTATVTDVAFNRQLASDILAGTVSQLSTLSIDCSAGGSAPDSLTLEVIPQRPHPTQGNDGYIRVDGREDVGYRLLWGDNSVGTKGDGVPTATALPVKIPTQARNDILLDVRPVSLNGAMPGTGNASTSVTIRVKYA